VVEATFRLALVGGAVDRREGFLQRPGLGDQRLALEQHAEPAALALAKPSLALSRRWRER
jgi:hypothetical protein